MNWQDALQTIPEGRRNAAFVRMVKWLLERDPEGWWPEAEASDVWTWDEYPDRSGPRKSIDLVLRTASGELWAIHCALLPAGRALGLAPVRSFLEAADPRYARRLVFTNATKRRPDLSKTVKNSYRNRPIQITTGRKLDGLSLDWQDFLDERHAELRPASPRDHQVDALAAIGKGLALHDRGQVIMCCGTGKTLTAMWVASAQKSKLTLVMLPTLSLLAQTYAVWAENTSEVAWKLAVCSDASVGSNSDDPWGGEASQYGISITTKADEIAPYLSQDAPGVIFCTYNSAPVLAAAYRATPGARPIDLMVFDEAHRAAGKLDKLAATALYDHKIPARKRLFFTATPRIFSPEVMEQAAEDEIPLSSMDDQALYGPVFYRLHFGEAIRRGLLSEYRIGIVGVNKNVRLDPELSPILKLGGKNLEPETVARASGLLEALAKYNLKRTLSFHKTIALAEQFAEVLEAVKGRRTGLADDTQLWARTVSSRQNTGQRRDIMEDFAYGYADRRAVLTNAKCLGEGIDVPSIDAVVFCDPKRSFIDIVQAVGRAIRRAEDKHYGYILIPAYIEEGQDASEVLEGSEFEQVWKVLQALRAHDDRLAGVLDEARQQLGEKPEEKPEEPEIDGLELLGSLAEEMPSGFLESFYAKLIDKTTLPWEEMLGALRAFVSTHGHCDVAGNYQVGHLELGRWVRSQSATFEAGQMPLDYQQKLLAIPGWRWKRSERRWIAHAQLVNRFCRASGHSWIPWGTHVEGIPLQEWCRNHRWSHAQGELAEWKRVALESVPHWAWETSAAFWGCQLALLRALPPSTRRAVLEDQLSESAGDKLMRLHEWVNQQREARRQERLSPERREALETIEGWNWDPRATSPVAYQMGGSARCASCFAFLLGVDERGRCARCGRPSGMRPASPPAPAPAPTATSASPTAVTTAPASILAEAAEDLPVRTPTVTETAPVPEVDLMDLEMVWRGGRSL